MSDIVGEAGVIAKSLGIKVLVLAGFFAFFSAVAMMMGVLEGDTGRGCAGSLSPHASLGEQEAWTEVSSRCDE